MHRHKNYGTSSSGANDSLQRQPPLPWTTALPRMLTGARLIKRLSRPVLYSPRSLTNYNYITPSLSDPVLLVVTFDVFLERVDIGSDWAVSAPVSVAFCGVARQIVVTGKARLEKYGRTKKHPAKKIISMCTAPAVRKMLSGKKRSRNSSSTL